MTDIHFFTLRTFSETGGIEKVCRVVGKALFEFGLRHDRSVGVISMHDKQSDAGGNAYFPSELFKGYGGNKVKAFAGMIRAGIKSKLVVFSHINLLPVARVIRMLNPGVKLVMFCHGIEVWGKGVQPNKHLQDLNALWMVSRFTLERTKSLHQLQKPAVAVLNNPLDPLLELPVKNGKVIKQRLGIPENAAVLFTLTRMNSGEQYKGYDKVITALAKLTEDGEDLHYVIGGKYDASEAAKVKQTVEAYNLTGRVHLLGFIPDADLPGYFDMADIYIMPSTEEGFGIVFIEAMHYGTRVIAGNRDGSVDALQDGALGCLIDPDDADEIYRAVKNRAHIPPADPEKVNALFGFTAYKERLEEQLNRLLN